jgi:hypothetical protein
MNSVKRIFAHPVKINFALVKKAVSGLYYAPAAAIHKVKLNRLANTIP